MNVGGTELVLDAARRAQAARFVHVSSNSPFGANAHPTDRFTEDSPFNPYMGYGASQLEAEQIVTRGHERGDVDAVIIRAPWFYGPYQPPRQSQWFKAVRKGRLPMLGDGTQQRSMVYRAPRAGPAAGRGHARGLGAPYWIAARRSSVCASSGEHARTSRASTVSSAVGFDSVTGTRVRSSSAR